MPPEPLRIARLAVALCGCRAIVGAEGWNGLLATHLTLWVKMSHHAAEVERQLCGQNPTDFAGFRKRASFPFPPAPAGVGGNGSKCPLSDIRTKPAASSLGGQPSLTDARSARKSTSSTKNSTGTERDQLSWKHCRSGGGIDEDPRRPREMPGSQSLQGGRTRAVCARPFWQRECRGRWSRASRI